MGIIFLISPAVARIEPGHQGADSRFIVTNLPRLPGRRITDVTKNLASLSPQDRGFDRPMNEAG